MKHKIFFGALLVSVLFISLGAGPLEAQAADQYSWSSVRSSEKSLTFGIWEDPRSQVTHVYRISDWLVTD
jgi:hypothetical protein